MDATTQIAFANRKWQQGLKVNIFLISNDNFYFPLLYRLDQILGRQGSKAKDVYDSKQSLASRVVKTERQVRFFPNCIRFFSNCPNFQLDSSRITV